MDKLLIQPDETGYGVTENDSNLTVLYLDGGTYRSRKDQIGGTREVTLQWSGSPSALGFRYQTVRDFLTKLKGQNFPQFLMDLQIDSSTYKEYVCCLAPASIKANRSGTSWLITAKFDVEPRDDETVTWPADGTIYNLFYSPEESTYSVTDNASDGLSSNYGVAGKYRRNLFNQDRVIDVSWNCSKAIFDYLAQVYRWFVENGGIPFNCDLILEDIKLRSYKVKWVSGSFKLDAVQGEAYFCSGQFVGRPNKYTGPMVFDPSLTDLRLDAEAVQYALSIKDVAVRLTNRHLTAQRLLYNLTIGHTRPAKPLLYNLSIQNAGLIKQRGKFRPDVVTYNVNIQQTDFEILVPASPVDLFTSRSGGYYDLGDASTLFSDEARTIPATIGGYVRGLKDKSGNGRHCTATANGIIMRAGYCEFTGAIPFISNDGPVGSYDGAQVIAQGYTIVAKAAPTNYTTGHQCIASSDFYPGAIDQARITQGLTILNSGELYTVTFDKVISSFHADSFNTPLAFAVNNTSNVLTTYRNSTICQLRIDGIDIANISRSVESSQYNASRIVIGGDYVGTGTPGRLFVGKIYKVVFVNDGSLSPTELTTTEAQVA